MEKIFNKIELFILCIIVFLLPLLFIPNFPNQFDTAKLILLFSGFAIISLSKLIKIFYLRRIDAKFNNNDIWVLMFAAVYLASSLIKTPNIYDALFVPGASAFIILSVIFYFFINQLPDKHKHYILFVLVVSVVVFALLQIISFLGVSQLPQYTTMGNLTSAIVLLLSTLSISVFYIIKSNSINEKVLHGFAAFIIFISSFAVIYMMIPGKQTSFTVPPFSTGWSIAIDNLKTSPLLGIGPGNYSEAFLKFKPIIFNQNKLWNIKFSNSTSQVLTMFTETGILGMLIFIILLTAFFRKSRFDKPIHLAAIVIASASLIIPFSYSVFVVFFVLLSLTQPGNSTVRNLGNTSKDKNIVPYLLLTLPLAILVGILSYFAARAVLSEYIFGQSLKSISSSQAEPAYKYINRAISISPKIDRYHLIASTINLGIAQGFSQKQEISEDEKILISQLIQQGIINAKAAVNVNPQKEINWENLANVYKSVIPFAKGADNFAIEAYKQAIFLEPINPNLRIALGGIYYSQKKYDEAVNIFELAVLAKPDYANAHFNLASAYKELGQIEKAKEQYLLTLNLVEKDSNDYLTIQKEIGNLINNNPTEILEVLPETENLTPPPTGAEPAIEPQIDLEEPPAETFTDI